MDVDRDRRSHPATSRTPPHPGFTPAVGTSRTRGPAHSGAGAARISKPAREDRPTGRCTETRRTRSRTPTRVTQPSACHPPRRRQNHQTGTDDRRTQKAPRLKNKLCVFGKNLDRVRTGMSRLLGKLPTRLEPQAQPAGRSRTHAQHDAARPGRTGPRNSRVPHPEHAAIRQRLRCDQRPPRDSNVCPQHTDDHVVAALRPPGWTKVPNGRCRTSRRPPPTPSLADDAGGCGYR